MLAVFAFAAIASPNPSALAQEAAAPPDPPPPQGAPAQQPSGDLSLDSLELIGARIGEIRIDTQNIFNLNDEKENGYLYALANALHIRTRQAVIRRQLLFRSGDRISKRVIEETERLLRSNRFLYDVSIVPTAYHDGVVDIEVKTRDTWTLEPGVSASRSGGTNKRGITLKDTNVLGTGAFAGISRSSDADRTSTEYRVSQPHTFDGWTSVDYSLTQLSDGLNRSMAVTRPFYELDARWAAGLAASNDNRLNYLYQDGVRSVQYRRREDRREGFAGWSPGLVDGWAHRYSLGMTYTKDAYSDAYTLDKEGTPVAPTPAPLDQTLVTPFLRYEVVQDEFEQVKNRDLIQRPEYFAMGFQSKLQLGRSLIRLGSTQNLWVYSASAGDGIRLPRGQTVLASATLDGQTGYNPLDRQTLGGSIRFYGNPKEDTLLFSSLSGDTLKDPTGSSQLLLGGDTGLRGYKRNFQSGDKRVLFSIEERVYTDWYPFRLFRVGGAVFYDHGRAWGGPTQNTANAGWLNDVGFGLRILSARSAFGNVLHIDLAFPLNRGDGIKSVQFLVQTKVTL